MNSQVKVVALYFPQFHAIPENDKWWGTGFTDWVNVRKTQPLFPHHHQPRKPLNDNYYDQSDISTIRWQIELAKQSGIYGFCHYHYWFDGKQLLETPTNLFLENKDIEFPFCLSWANETWSRRWTGKDQDILIQQTHPPTEASWSKHFDYLIKAWTDDRAIKIDGKPIFIIYRPQKIPGINDMLAYWQKRAKNCGLKGIYFIFQKPYECPVPEALNSFDGVFYFQPFEGILNSAEKGLIAAITGSKRVARRAHKLIKMTRGTPIKYDYNKVWKQILQRESDKRLTTFHGAFVDWDNTSRYGKRAMVFEGANPQNFGRWFKRLVLKVKDLPENERYIFINAWNEWSEGTYLEPDQENGTQYLSEISAALTNCKIGEGENDQR